jgi:hypothetical protein
VAGDTLAEWDGVRRSLGVVAVGWVAGFLVAIALGSTHTNNAGVASALSRLALAGIMVLALLLLAGELSKRAARRALTDESDADIDGAAREAAEAERRSAARIAELETSLARELEKLDSAAASLAATPLVVTERVTAEVPEPLSDAAASDLEPVLRREVVEAVAELVEHADAGQTAELAGRLEALLGKPR